jgi:hypothetical protein
MACYFETRDGGGRRRRLPLASSTALKKSRLATRWVPFESPVRVLSPQRGGWCFSLWMRRHRDLKPVLALEVVSVSTPIAPALTYRGHPAAWNVVAPPLSSRRSSRPKRLSLAFDGRRGGRSRGCRSWACPGGNAWGTECAEKTASLG